MTEQEQIAHFDTFDFLCLRQAFSPAEMEEITGAAECLWENNGSESAGYFAELNARLTQLADDDRIHDPISRLLDPGYILVGVIFSSVPRGSSAITPGVSGMPTAAITSSTTRSASTSTYGTACTEAGKTGAFSPSSSPPDRPRNNT